MKIIAFGHRSLVGKDTAAKFALSYLRLNRVDCSRLSFGDPIKDIAYRMYAWAGIQPGIYYDNHAKEKETKLPVLGQSPREVYEQLGLAGHTIDPRTWCELALKDVEGDLLINSDLRRPTEAEYAHKFNGLCVKIINERAPVRHGLDDMLENYLDWDAVIVNNGTLKELNNKIVDFLKHAGY